MPVSRRELIKGLAMIAPTLFPIGISPAVAQSSGPMPSDGDTEAFLKLFEESWRPLDPQVRLVLRLIYGGLRGLPPPAQLPVAELRRINASLSFYLNAGAPALPHVEERTINVPSGRARIRLYDPGTPAPAPTVVLLHGGGWVMGSLDTYDGFARQIAKRSGLRCLSVDYALAPEHPFPAPLNDCIAALRWAMSEGAGLGIDPQRVALVGDSAGANLSLAACLALRENGSRQPRGAALLYGGYSLDFNTESQRAYGSGAYFLGTVEMQRYWNDYLPDQAARQNPLAVPMLATLDGLPPLYVAACEFDPLLNESQLLAERAKAAGVDCELRLWKGVVHAAVSLMGWINAMGPEVDRVGEFLRRVTRA